MDTATERERALEQRVKELERENGTESTRGAPAQAEVYWTTASQIPTRRPCR